MTDYIASWLWDQQIATHSLNNTTYNKILCNIKENRPLDEIADWPEYMRAHEDFTQFAAEYQDNLFQRYHYYVDCREDNEFGKLIHQVIERCASDLHEDMYANIVLVRVSFSAIG